MKPVVAAAGKCNRVLPAPPRVELLSAGAGSPALPALTTSLDQSLLRRAPERHRLTGYCVWQREGRFWGAATVSGGYIECWSAVLFSDAQQTSNTAGFNTFQCD